MKEIPVILLIAFTLGSIIFLWVWRSTKNPTDDDEKDDFECFEDFEDYDIEDYDIDMKNDDDTEFIKYWYS